MSESGRNGRPPHEHLAFATPAVRAEARRHLTDRRTIPAECAPLAEVEERIEADDDGGDTSPDLLAAAVRAACSAAVERGDRKLTVTVEKVNGQFRGRWNALSEESGEVPLMPEQPPKR